MAWPPCKSQLSFRFHRHLDDQRGQAGKRLTIHTNVVAASSQCLKVALSPGRQHGLEKDIVVHGVNQPTLESYLHWMYTDCILEREKAKHYGGLFALYLLGDSPNDALFCEQVIEAIICMKDGFVWPPLQPDVSFVWEHTLPTSPLRRVIKEIWLNMPISSSVQAFQGYTQAPYPMDFVLKLFSTLVEHCNGATNTSFSGKTFDELKVACVDFVKDAAQE